MSHSKKILVAGATGRQGGAVVRHLLRNNFNVIALSRTPDSLASQKLISAGIEVVKGDMADPASLVNAMKDCKGVFSIQNYFEYGAEKEILYGKNMADAASKSGIDHFIYSSVCNADEATAVPHFATKLIIEEYVRKSGIPFTILRPVKFMENYYIPQVFKGILGGKLFDSIQAGKRHQMISVDDVGKYAAAAFLEPEKCLNKTIELSGDELTNEQVAATMSAALGMKVKFSRLPLFIVKLVMDKEMYLMFKWFNDKGFKANQTVAKNSFPSAKAMTLHEFLIQENWLRWNKKGTI